MTKKGKKQDVNNDSFESYVKDCLETIRQDVESIKNNQAKSGAPNDNFQKISVRKTIWDLEFSEHLF